jgi:hypothetical protein
LKTLEDRPDARSAKELIVNPGSGLRETVTGIVVGTVGVAAGLASGGVVIGVVTIGA